MVTSVSNNIQIAGYSSLGNTIVQSSRVPAVTGEQSMTGDDTVTLSQEARSIQKTYQDKEDRLEQSYASDKDQLEREFQQEKARLQQEYNQKRQSMGINLFA